MILEIIMFAILSILGIFAQFIPGSGQVPLLLPWGLDDIINAGVVGYKTLSTAYPPFAIVLQAFIIYIGFKITMQLLKAVPILGRTLR